MSQYITWSSWSPTSISNATITTGNSATTGTLSLNNKIAAQIAVEMTYGATKNRSAQVYVLRDVNGSDETRPNAYVFNITGAALESHKKTFDLPATSYNDVVIEVVNDSGSSFTGVTISVATATLEST